MDYFNLALFGVLRKLGCGIRMQNWVFLFPFLEDFADPFKTGKNPSNSRSCVCIFWWVGKSINVETLVWLYGNSRLFRYFFNFSSKGVLIEIR